MVRESYRGACSVGNIHYRMGIAFLFCGICILHALCSKDHEGCLLTPTTVDTDLVNHIFNVCPGWLSSPSEGF